MVKNYYSLTKITPIKRKKCMESVLVYLDYMAYKLVNYLNALVGLKSKNGRENIVLYCITMNANAIMSRVRCLHNLLILSCYRVHKK